MKRFSDRLYDALRSVKLAAVLILLIIIMAAAGGIVPQGETSAFYLQKFPGSTAKIILSLGLDKIFSGLPFLAISALFTINLTICTFHRFFSEMQKPRKTRRHGADLLHIGLIIFIFGGILTARTRSEAFIHLGKGQSARLPDGSRITLIELTEDRYPDGRPKSWESKVVLDDRPVVDPSAGSGDDFDTLGKTGYAGQDPTLDARGMSGDASDSPLPSSSTSTTADRNSLPAKGVRTVKVNSPLRHKGYTIYQQDWNSETQVQLQDAMGIRLSLEPGEKAQMQGGFVLYMSVEKNPPTVAGAEECSNYEATFLIDTGGKREVRKARKGETLGLFTFIGFAEKPISGLKIVQDKGYPFVITGLVLVLLGTFITYFRKLRGMIA